MTIEIAIIIILTMSNIGAFINNRKDEKYIKELEKENTALQELLKLPKHMQLKTINKAWKNKK